MPTDITLNSKLLFWIPLMNWAHLQASISPYITLHYIITIIYTSAYVRKLSYILSYTLYNYHNYYKNDFFYKQIP